MRLSIGENARLAVFAFLVEGTATRSRHDYTHNNLYQRVTAKQSGSAYDDYGDPTFQVYGYNSRGELTAAKAYLGATVPAGAAPDLNRPMPGRQHEFDYDSIGNRKWSNRTGDPSKRESYFQGVEGTPEATLEGANNLNQYIRKENDSVAVQGTVGQTTTTVTVESAGAPGRQGRYWAAEALVSNNPRPWAGNLSVQAVGNISGTTWQRTESRAGRLPPAVQTFAYDPDGNLISDGVWEYTYDAENRLTKVKNTTAAVTGGWPNREIHFRYDYLGRRVEKRVLNGPGGAEISCRRYLYTGWDLVAEFDAPGGAIGALVRSYTWGLDLAGSRTASGGIGALVQIHDHAQGLTLLPTYDGNGNVTALVNASGGTVEAAYEYDPSGQLLRKEGAYAVTNPFRFSTKFTDEETGLVYYGHRFYSPAMGRFINRDPSGEQGGINLYGFAANDPINGGDYLGLSGLGIVGGFLTNVGNALAGALDRLLGGGSDATDRPTGGGGFPPYFPPEPPDDYYTEDGYTGPDYASRRAGVFIVGGSIPRSPYETSAIRGRSASDSRFILYATAPAGPNRGPERHPTLQGPRKMRPEDPEHMEKGWYDYVFLTGMAGLRSIAGNGAPGVSQIIDDYLETRGLSDDEDLRRFAEMGQTLGGAAEDMMTGRASRPGVKGQPLPQARRMPQHLRTKLQKIEQYGRNGMKQIGGSVTPLEGRAMAEQFVGPGFVETRVGNTWQITSADGLRTVRGPSEKPTDAGRNMNPVSGQPYSATGVQMNFQTRGVPSGPWQTNVHLDVK